MELFKSRVRASDDPAAMQAIMAVFQNYVQQADGKASAFVVVHAASAAAVIAPGRAAAELGAVGGAVAYLLLGLFLLGFLVSGYHVLRVLWPRLTPPALPSRYAITGVANRAAADLDPSAEAAEAWAMVQLLAEIAERKHRHIRRAIPWSGLAVASVTLWTVLVVAWR